MTFVGEVDLHALVSEVALKTPHRTEADVQASIQSLLLFGGLNLEDPQVRLETPVPGRRRIDIEVGHAVIECKRDLAIGNVRDDAAEQLAGYVRDRTVELGQRYAGILTDGHEWSLYHLDLLSDELQLVSTHVVSPLDPDVGSLLVWLEGVLATGEQIQPTPHEIERRLGSTAPGFELDLAELRDVYEQCREDSEVRQKRELWTRLLSAAFGRNFEDNDELFIEHTYLVLTAEVIAHAVVGFDLRAGALSAKDLITGSAFRRASINGVVEADFFDWPADAPPGASFVEGLARRLSRFDWQSVEHDVLKVLYESVIDPQTRHSLGEYYTPDWLAERVVTEVVDDPLQQRTLDPACGSGTFVFWAVRRYLEAADSAGIANRDAVRGVTAHVFGIDLHPVAVTLARVTYLLALGTERLADRDALSIPIYLGDSIQLNQSTSVLSAAGLTVHTTDGLELFARELSFPESVVADADRFDRLVDELATKAAQRRNDGTPPAITQTMTNYRVSEQADRAMVEASYRVLCHLHDSNRNHIWGYYVRNLARPLEFTRTAQRVDRLVGNPPWLRYNAMPASTQDHFRRLTRARSLQAAAQVVTSQDLSALFAALTTELYLRLGGRFGFVMPAAALSRLQYRGFRAGDYSSQAATCMVAFDEPWELSRLRPQPFPVPAAVVFGRRVDADELSPMPEQAVWWAGDVGHHHRAWEAMAPLVTQAEADVKVAGETFASPYADLVRQGSNLVPRVLLAVRRSAAGPLALPTGQVAVESARLGGEKPPWSALTTLSGEVEDRFVFPMLLGDSVLPFGLRGDAAAVVPWNGTKLLRGSDEAIEEFPGLAAWWRRCERLFSKHRSETTTLDLVGQINYQGKLAAQFPVAEHRVVYTGRGEIVTAARVTTVGAIVDHALYWAGFDSAEEALYVVGVINTSGLGKRIAQSLSQGLFGGRNIHRAPFLVAWPQYDSTQKLHREIASAARHAEGVTAEADGQHGGLAAARGRVRQALTADGVAGRLEQLVEELFAGGLDQ